jgi:Ulp1 family protease
MHLYALKILKLKFYFKDILDIITPLPTMQQQNCYNCGIYLICNAESVAQCVCANSDIHNIDPVYQVDLKNKHASIVNLIYKLARRNISLQLVDE